jgi:hypothetical protein
MNQLRPCAVHLLRSFAGWAEPPGERFSQHDSGGIGGFVYGCRPGDVGAWADQDGVGWLVIGFGCVDIDALVPVSGGGAEFWAVGEVEEYGTGGVHEFGNTSCALVSAQGQIGHKGAR